METRQNIENIFKHRYPFKLKSLEQVIKQKCKFLCHTTEPEAIRSSHFGADFHSEKLLYMSKTTIETANLITLLEEMKPLFVYIISYVLYEGLQITWEVLYIRIRFQNTYLGSNDNIKFWSNIYENPLGSIQDRINIYKKSPYYMSYQDPLRVEILFLRRRVIESSNFKKNKIESINNIKTFRKDECVICLTEQPNVLFCECGHICLCTSCNKKQVLEKCPLCKTKNTILRVIE